jgi:hypothetical protein
MSVQAPPRVPLSTAEVKASHRPTTHPVLVAMGVARKKVTYRSVKASVCRCCPRFLVRSLVSGGVQIAQTGRGTCARLPLQHGRRRSSRRVRRSARRCEEALLTTRGTTVRVCRAVCPVSPADATGGTRVVVEKTPGGGTVSTWLRTAIWSSMGSQRRRRGECEGRL